MYKKYTREINAPERAKLELAIGAKRLAPSLSSIAKWLSLWAGGFALFVVGLGIVISTSNSFLAGILGGLLGLLAFVCLCAFIMMAEGYWRWKRFDGRFEKKVKPTLLKALKEGMVMAQKVSASAVVEIVELEDEGPGYIFDVGEGKIFFLKGQRFDADLHDRWPNSDFEIVRTNMGNHWIGIFCNGEMLKPTRTLKTADLKHNFVFAEREELVDAEMNRFADSLLKSTRTRTGV